jgi:hypothetical protein
MDAKVILVLINMEEYFFGSEVRFDTVESGLL